MRELHSQYPVFVYIDEEGVIRKHVCDFYVVFDDGHRLAVPVKYSRKEEQMESLITRIRKAGFTRLDKGGKLTVGAVDDMRLMTEIDATIDDFENAQAILHSREHFDASQCEELYKMVRKLPGCFRFGELLRHSSNRAKRRTAIWQLIDRGHLLAASKGRVDELSWLRFRG